MASLSVKLQFDPVRSVGYASISSTYVGIGTSLANAASQIFVQNLTNASLMFSFDGVNDHFPLPANGFFLNDIGSNRAISQAFFLAAGERLYVKNIGTAMSGSVYFTVAYGYNG